MIMANENNLTEEERFKTLERKGREVLKGPEMMYSHINFAMSFHGLTDSLNPSVKNPWNIELTLEKRTKAFLQIRT